MRTHRTTYHLPGGRVTVSRYSSRVGGDVRSDVRFWSVRRGSLTDRLESIAWIVGGVAVTAAGLPLLGIPMVLGGGLQLAGFS